MYLAPIATQRSIEYTAGARVHMALAHIAINDRDYSRFFLDERVVRNAYVIVDNGEHEGRQLPFEQVVDAALLCGANEIVMPDVMRDAAETVRRCRALEGYETPFSQHMIVPQGKNWQEWRWCLNELLSIFGQHVTCIGLAKHIESWNGGRRFALQILLEQEVITAGGSGMDIHMLGVYNQPFREVMKACVVYPYVRSIDTSLPVACSQVGEVICDYIRPVIDWEGDVPEQLARANIQMFDMWCKTRWKE